MQWLNKSEQLEFLMKLPLSIITTIQTTLHGQRPIHCQSSTSPLAAILPPSILANLCIVDIFAKEFLDPAGPWTKTYVALNTHADFHFFPENPILQ